MDPSWEDWQNGNGSRETGNSGDMWAGVEDGWNEESGFMPGQDDWQESPVRHEEPGRAGHFEDAFVDLPAPRDPTEPPRGSAQDRSLDELDTITQNIRDRHGEMTGWERGLGLDPKWAYGMEKAVAQLGEPKSVTPPKKISATKEMMDSAVNRLRMLEEDRDELALQAVSLQRSVDAERTQRLVAEEAQAAAQQQLLQLDEGEHHTRQSAAQRLADLEAQVASLKTELDAGRQRQAAPAPEVIEALQQRAEFVENLMRQKQEARNQAQSEMVKKIGITLKVLQLQKEHSQGEAQSREKVGSLLGQAVAEVGALTQGHADRKDAAQFLSRRMDVVVTQESARNRELASMRAESEALLRQLSARTTQLEQYEQGILQDLHASEYERQLHVQTVQECLAEMNLVMGMR